LLQLFHNAFVLHGREGITKGRSPESEGRVAREEGEKPMSHDAAVPKGPAPQPEVIIVRKPMKYLGTLLSTQTEEIFNRDGTKKRVTTVRRSVRR
jgi:hypothetical protein